MYQANKQIQEVVTCAHIWGAIGYCCKIYLDCWNDGISISAFMGDELADTYVFMCPTSRVQSNIWAQWI